MLRKLILFILTLFSLTKISHSMQHQNRQLNLEYRICTLETLTTYISLYKNSESRNTNKERNDFLDFFDSWIKEFFLAITIKIEYSPYYKSYVSDRNDDFELKIDSECEAKNTTRLSTYKKQLLKKAIYLEKELDQQEEIQQRRFDQIITRIQSQRSQIFSNYGFTKRAKSEEEIIPIQFEKINPTNYISTLSKMKVLTDTAISFLKIQHGSCCNEYSLELTRLWLDKYQWLIKSESESESDEDFQPRTESCVYCKFKI